MLALGAVLALAPTAGAAVVNGQGGARFGVQAISAPAASQSAQPMAVDDGMMAGPADSGDAVYHGGPVVHGLTTYAIFWDPGSAFQGSTESLISRYLADVAHDSGTTGNLFSVADQYSDGQGGASYAQSFGGEYVDTDPYPTSGNCGESTATATTCLYDSQEIGELQSFITSHNLPRGLGAMYFVITPDTTVTCMDGSSECSNNSFCSYHSYAGSGSQTVLYAAIPFTLLDSASDAKSCQDDGNGIVETPNADPGFGDVAIKSMSHEEMETITDPLMNAWYFANGDEIADACNGVFWNPDAFLPSEGGSATAGTLFNQTINGDHYYVQGSWSNATQSCALSTALVPSITAPASATPGSSVALAAAASTNAAVTYAWQFGDGQTGSGQDVTHVYAAAGTYTLTLTATDAYGDSGSTTSRITIAAAASQTHGTTAGKTGARKGKTTTKCGATRRSGATKTRLCTTTTISYASRQLCKRASVKDGKAKARSCREVTVKITRRQRCTLSNSNQAEIVSSRCTPVVTHETVLKRRT